MKVYDTLSAAKELGESRTTISQKINRGELLTFAINNRHYIPEVFLDYTPKRQKKCVVLTFSNIKGGVGKTSISTAYAVFLSKLGKKVLFIDTDAQANASFQMVKMIIH
jgi:Mrp family chromosome partitioning ATPase